MLAQAQTQNTSLKEKPSLTHPLPPHPKQDPVHVQELVLSQSQIKVLGPVITKHFTEAFHPNHPPKNHTRDKMRFIT